MANKGHENLIPAKPREVRNPNGRPKGSRNRSTIVREIIEATIEGQEWVDVMTKSIVEKAVSGDVSAYRELMDSAYGKVADKSEITGKDGGPIETKDLTKTDEDIIARYLQQKGAKE